MDHRNRGNSIQDKGSPKYSVVEEELDQDVMDEYNAM